MVYVFLAEGFEELEAIEPVDILLRGGVDVKTVGVTGKTVAGAHGIPFVADIEIKDAAFEGLEGIVLPGGMPGTTNLENSADVQKFIDYAYNNGLFTCAICAAPTVFGHKGMLEGKKAICYPSLEPQLKGASVVDEQAVKDGNIITGKGPGAAKEFGFAILNALKGDAVCETVKNEMCYK